MPAIAELFAAQEEAKLGRPSHLTVDDVDGWLQTTTFETNTWLFEEDRPVATAFAQLHGDRGFALGAVHPSAEERGLGSQLIELTERRMSEEKAVRILAWTLAADLPAAELFIRHGYREVRRFWEMAIDLEREPAAPAIAIETFREEEAAAFHAAAEEAFEDHWEPQAEPFETWWSRQRARSNYDPSLWFVVRDGEEVVAIARNEQRVNGGYVGSLGVRRAWRGRGYGRALLLHTFREFRRRGLTRATLGVDAANPTGATQLYESVGMHVDLESVVWEKLLA